MKYWAELKTEAPHEERARRLDEYLEPLGPVTKIRLGKTGKAYGLRVRVEAWLCGPVSYPLAPSGTSFRL